MYPYDQTNHQMYERYAQAHDTGDYEGIDHGQAVGHVQQFMQQAPPEVQQKAGPPVVSAVQVPPYAEGAGACDERAEGHTLSPSPVMMR